jgi:DTW domain-containing protein YfiP
MGGASRSIEVEEARTRCYKCYRPMSSCMCPHVKPIETKTKFVILMHPKEFKKIKNGTGHLTHLSLPNSELFVDIDFSEHSGVNALLADENNLCYVLYPGDESLNLNREKIEADGRQVVIFIIDSTWACSVKMLRLSRNLQKLPKLSFTHSKSSQFQIKAQPEEICLSTIESTQTILELLNEQKIEQIDEAAFGSFLDPFKAMVAYQIGCISRSESNHVNAARFKRRTERAGL